MAMRDVGAELIDAASWGNSTAKVEALIDEGADPNARDTSGLTPLLVAALNGRTKNVRVLVASGADVEAEGASMRPLAAAASRGWAETVQALIDAGADLEGGSIFGTPLVAAAGRGHEEAVKVLMKAGAKVEALGADPRWRG